MIYYKAKILAALVLFSVFGVFAEINFYVFFPVQIRPKVLEEKLNSLNSSVKVTVFGRYRDFIDRTRLDKPEAVFVKSELLSEISSYSQGFRGSTGSSDSSKYFLLTLNDRLSLEDLTGTTVGVVDFLGRRNLEKVISDSFTFPLILKRVRKLEDLLPLLMFQMVSAIIVDSKDIKYYKSRSNAELHILALPKFKTSIASVGLKDDKFREIIKAVLNGFTPELKVLLGVEKWN